MKPKSKARIIERQSLGGAPKYEQVTEERKHGSSIQKAGTKSSKSYSKKADIEGARLLRLVPRRRKL
jgi:hypothetical protein